MKIHWCLAVHQNKNIKESRETPTFGTPPFARPIISPSICSLQGLAANLLTHLTAPIPWFARTHGTEGKYINIGSSGIFEQTYQFG
jgi:hypothetical protein